MVTLRLVVKYIGCLSPYYRESSLSTVRFCPEGIKTAEVEGKGIGVIAS